MFLNLLIKAISLSIDHVLNQAKMTLNDIDYVICHQANERIIKHVYKNINVQVKVLYELTRIWKHLSSEYSISFSKDE